MKKSEAIKNAIELNINEVEEGILVHRGVRYSYEDGAGTHESSTTKLVLGLPSVDAKFKMKLARAREVAMSTLKMVGADVLVIDCGYKEKNWRLLHELKTRGSGRILGMTVKETKVAGSLPLGAIFMITDRPEVSQEAEEAAGYQKVGPGAFVFGAERGKSVVGSAASEWEWSKASGGSGGSGDTEGVKEYTDGVKEYIVALLKGVAEKSTTTSRTVSSLVDAWKGIAWKGIADKESSEGPDGKKNGITCYYDDIPF